MQRVILGYAPANIIPALVSIGAIYVFTRLLNTQAFGHYNLAFSVVMVAQSCLFFAPALAITRFYPAAETGHGVGPFLQTMYALLLALSAVAILAAAGLYLLVGGAGLRDTLGDTTALVLPLLLLRALVATNQTVNRAAGRMMRFNLIECLHAVLGVAAGLVIVVAGVRSGAGVMAGLTISAAVCAAVDARTALRGLLGAASSSQAMAPAASGRPAAPHLTREVLRFCWPLAIAYVVGCGLQYADRFIVDAYSGASAVGIYVVAFSLVDRPISLICLSITAGTFPMAVESYVRDGAEAGRRQAGRNGAVLLGLALPACLGLIVTSPSLAAVLVAPPYRDGVAQLIPIMAVTALLRGVCAHYIDHAFHLANKSLRLLAVYAPSAIGSIVLSLVFVPRYGMVAAAYSALAAQAVAALVGAVAAWRVLPLWLPGREMAKVGLGLGVMAAVLFAIPLPVGWVGLFGATALGLVAYAGCAVAVDLAGLRRVLRRVRPGIPDAVVEATVRQGSA